MTEKYRIRPLTITESTNDDAKKAGEAGEAEGLVIWALQQKSGRGRFNRRWISPLGNLYISILLRPTCEARYCGHYAFVAALAVFDAVAGLLPQHDIKIKWPNDILADGKKISGILIENSLTKDGKPDWLVTGIGLNVEHHPTDTNFPATSMRTLTTTLPSLSEILEKLLDSFFEWKEMLEKHDFSVIREVWLSRVQKGKIKVLMPTRAVEGEFAGIDDDGGLLLQLADGSKQAIAAGDVFFT